MAEKTRVGRLGVVGPLVASLMLVGCSAQLLKRYENKRVLPNDPDNLVKVSVFVTEQPTKTSKKIQSLSDHGQAALIERLADEVDSETELLEVIASDIKKKSSRALIDDKTSFNRRVVLSTESVASGRWDPSDRIQSLRCTLNRLEPEGTRFVSWEAVATKYAAVDVGKMKLEQAIGGTLSAGVGKKDSTPSASGEVKASRTLTEEVELKQRYIVLNAMLKENDFVISQEGTPGIDLTGNALIDLTVQVPGRTYAVMSGGTMKGPENATSGTSVGWLPPAEVKIERWKVRFPAVAADVRGSMSCAYTLRQAFRGGRTVTESDDYALFIRGNTPANGVPFIKRNETSATLWIIEDDDPLLPNQLEFERRSWGPGEELWFPRMEDAVQFYSNLKAAAEQSPCDEVIRSRVVFLIGSDCKNEFRDRSKCRPMLDSELKNVRPVGYSQTDRTGQAWVVEGTGPIVGRLLKTRSIGSRDAPELDDRYFGFRDEAEANGFIARLKELVAQPRRRSDKPSFRVHDDLLLLGSDLLDEEDVRHLQAAHKERWVLALDRSARTTVYQSARQARDQVQFVDRGKAQAFMGWLRHRHDEAAAPRTRRNPGPPPSLEDPVTVGRGQLWLQGCPLAHAQVRRLDLRERIVNNHVGSEAAKPRLEASQEAITVDASGEGTLHYEFKNPSGAEVQVRIGVTSTGRSDTVAFKPAEMAERFRITDKERGNRNTVAQFVTEKFEDSVFLALPGLADVDAVRVEADYRYLHEVAAGPEAASPGAMVIVKPMEFKVGVRAFVGEDFPLEPGYSLAEPSEMGETLLPGKEGHQVFQSARVYELEGPPKKPIIRVVAVDRPRALGAALQNLANLLDQLDASDFESLASRQALLRQVEGLSSLTREGKFEGLSTKLEDDVLSRTNGCASALKAPDDDDVVRTCTAQSRITPWIRRALELAGPTAGTASGSRVTRR